MKRFDKNAKYYEADFWIRRDGDFHTLGVTDFGQEFFRDLNTVDLPEVGTSIKKGITFCSVESDKVSTDLIAPISGKVVKTNPDLIENANWINEFPYSKGWILKLKNVADEEFNALSDADEYVATIKIFFNK